MRKKQRSIFIDTFLFTNFLSFLIFVELLIYYSVYVLAITTKYEKSYKTSSEKNYDYTNVF